MKAIFAPLSYRFQNIYFAAQSVMGKNFIPWNIQHKPIYDLIDETSAQYLFCEQQHIDQSVYLAIQEKNINLVMFGAGVPGELLAISQPKLLCCPKGVTSHVKKQLDQLENKTIYLLDCANIVPSNKIDLNLTSQVGFLSVSDANEYSDYKTIVNTIRFLGLQPDIQLKIVGPKILPVPQYLGHIQSNEFASFYQSVDINLDFDGKNLLDVAISKAFCLSNVPNKLYPHYSDRVDLIKKIAEYTEKPKARRKIAKQAFESIIESDTSLSRLSDIFVALNELEMDNICTMKYEEMVDEIRNND